MINKRERTIFETTKLKVNYALSYSSREYLTMKFHIINSNLMCTIISLQSFSDYYHSKRDGKATKSKEFLTVLGNQVNRSNSIAEELFATNILR